MRRSLHKKIIFTMLASVMVFVALSVLSVSALVVPNYYKLEHEEATKNAKRAMSYFENRIQSLSGSAKDWAIWTDTYNFIENPAANKAYKKENLNNSSIYNLGIDVMLIFNSKKELIWGKVEDSLQIEGINLETILTVDVMSSIVKLKDNENAFSSIVKTPSGFMMFSTCRTSDTKESKPYNGYIVMGKMIDGQMIGRVSKDLSLPVAYYDEKSLPSKFEEVKKSKTKDFAVIDISDNHVFGARRFDTANGSALYVVVDNNANLIRQGKNIILYFVISIVMIGLMLMFVVGRMITNSFVKPLSKIHGELDKIVKKGGDGSSALGFQDVSVFKDTLKDFVNYIEKDKVQTVKTSFAQGQEDIKSGILHNVRNSLTPISLSLEGLLTRLKERGEVLDNLEQAIEYVLSDKENVSAEDKEKLKEYIKLAIGRIKNLRVEMSDKLEMSLGMMSITERMLARKNFSAQQETDLDKVHLKTCIEAAIRDYKAENIDLNIDIPYEIEVKASPVYLEHAVINLVSNSITAINESMPVKGIINISASVLDDGMVKINVEDNGCGIEKDKFQKIFTRDYSTKRNEDGGEGLHWTANIINKMGGKIDVASEGADKGTCMSMYIPQFKAE